MAAFTSRTVVKTVLSREQSEGMGARVRRSIGRPELPRFDPFLLLDEFNVGAPAGFPDHPHRGFETVTYIYPHSEGTFQHEDFCGHKGTIGAGDVQWMTAGRGIVHAEMPHDERKSQGLQLWVNLAAKDKMCEPAYQELTHKELAVAEKEGVKAIVIAGEALGAKSPIFTRVPTTYIHLIMQPGARLQQPLDPSHNAFVYTIQGILTIGGSDVGPHHTVVLSAGDNTDGVEIVAGEAGGQLVLLSGQPIGEPVVQHGPFVMNTDEDVQRTFMDYQLARNGFERAKGWQSVIGLHS
ncbi:unnamed protein product [Vitrella brassicaformis CCMP3155]|uniref:Pirin n=2 Tax=Vitrella brassicaformis TaxID=1169539 RepID=A0A0G4EHK2_VITBC|nr:unnamed protein product [Vitrella brassicaformis CCMP3155]|eukprot:CEL95379.1 unnamed protein product [Vitrella brassicaformis CCMP3155]